MKTPDSVFWREHPDDFHDAILLLDWEKIMGYVDTVDPCAIGEEVYTALYKVRRIIEEEDKMFGYPDDQEPDDPRHGQADGINRGEIR